MNKRAVFFNEVLPKVAELILAQTFPSNIEPLVIRDIHGRIRVAINMARGDCVEIISALEKNLSVLGVYCNTEASIVLCREDFFDSDSIFNSTEILLATISGHAPSRIP